MSRESSGGEASHLAHQICDTLEENLGGDQKGCISEEYGKKPVTPKGADNPVASTSTQETPESTDDAIKGSIQMFSEGPAEKMCDEAWETCEKKDLHNFYFAAPEFRKDGMKYLPERYRTEDWFKLVLAFMDMTVRILVTSLSPKRPTEYKETNHIIGDAQYFGSGFITRCYKSFDGDAIGDKMWRFRINTAKHVIFDEHEVKAARIDLFFERKDSRVEYLWGLKCRGYRDDHDNMWFDAYTKDQNVAKTIIDKFKRLRDLRKTVYDQCTEDRRIDNETSKHIVIISHPHGQPKKVSIGKLAPGAIKSKGKHYRSGSSEGKGYYMEWLECSYNAVTCVSSSGAEILFLCDEGERGRHGWTIGAHNHSIGSRKKNWTGFGYGILFTYDSGWNKII